MQPYAHDFSNAYMQQWNLNLQREFFGAWLATAAYVGSKGTRLFNALQANPAVYRPGATTGNTDARRLYAPNFASVSLQASNANSTYHSMQLSLNRRFTQGFTLLAAYTWSKTIDDASGDGGASPNPFDQKFNRGLSDLDIPHRFVASFVYELPRLSGASPVLKWTVGGWDLNGIISLQSGSPFTVVSGRDNSFSGVNSDRADLIGNPYLPTDRPRGELVNRYFNTDAFTFNAVGTFGTAGRNIMRGPGDVFVDLGIFKNFALFEGHRIQFRVETFNAFNRVNLGNPNANRNAAAFGRITSAGSPRVLQMALKYQF